MRVSQQAAIVLHNRPYTESSLLVDVFSADFGRLSLLAKGARRPKERAKKAVQPFQDYLLSWSGKGELPILTQIDYANRYRYMDYKSRVCGFYANELLTRTMQRYDSHPIIYSAYSELLNSLAIGLKRELALRKFEKTLLTDVGYALILDKEIESGDSIMAHLHYHYVRGRGPVLVTANQHSWSEQPYVSGEVLLSLAHEHYKDDQVMHAAKLFMRKILTPMLGNKPLYSRDLLYAHSR